MHLGRGGGGYVKTQLSLYPIYYADDMFRPLWVIFRSQKCIMRKTIQCMIIIVFLYIHFCDLKMAHCGRNMSSA